jgi:hypothetical protein
VKPGIILNQIGESIWELSRPLKAPGLRVGHRMTVVRLQTGELWVHSPVQFDQALATELKALGTVQHFIAPSALHDLYWKEWFANFREATFYRAPGLKENPREFAFDRVLDPNVREPWENELPKLLVRGMPKINEFVFLHSATRTLIVTDMVFNFDIAQQNQIGKLFLKLNGIYGRVGCSRLFRLFIKDRDAFRQSIAEILALDFDRLVLAHGTIVNTHGKQTLAQTFDWLRKPEKQCGIASAP